jgi:hypothetical protein
MKNQKIKAARSVVAAATYAGKLKRASARWCERCHEYRATARHHDDYDKPLEVVYLCHKCHVEHHIATTGKWGRHSKRKAIAQSQFDFVNKL